MLYVNRNYKLARELYYYHFTTSPCHCLGPNTRPHRVELKISPVIPPSMHGAVGFVCTVYVFLIKNLIYFYLVKNYLILKYKSSTILTTINLSMAFLTNCNVMLSCFWSFTFWFWRTLIEYFIHIYLIR